MRHRTAAVGAMSFLLAALGCSSNGRSGDGTVAAATAAAPSPAAAPAPKEAAAAPQEDLVTTGPVTMEQQIDVVALRPGVVTSMTTDVDSAVSKGQTLAQLDDRQVTADRDAARFKVQSLESDLKNWQSEVDVRKTDLQRAEAMRQAGINTQEALDHVRYDLTATQYEVDRQRGEMQAAQASLQSLDLELQKTRITAPFAGVISQRYVRLGQYVNLGDRLFQITGNSPMEVRFTLPERDIPQIRRGEHILVSPTPDFRQTATASVTHLSPVVDPGSGTIEVTAVLVKRVPGLLPGMVANIRIPRLQ
ncbi:MAG TPA: efflux RND transporter periplasmic adaptor subunit [Acidobacteriaceae bacterium]|jgi:RND family efflux transporter MFP subunit|nr:efflux RND transporter periplasmic adaptor subunit [Acidobacteriaceae bacterium]